MKTFLAALLISSIAFADPPVDAPLADPDAQGRAVILEHGDIAPYRGVLLDAQEDVHRERSRVRAEVSAETWRRIAIGSISAGAAVTVTLIVLTALSAANKL